MLTPRDHVAVKTAMKKEQVRERERYTRKTRFSPPFTWKKCFCRTPYYIYGVCWVAAPYAPATPALSRYANVTTLPYPIRYAIAYTVTLRERDNAPVPHTVRYTESRHATDITVD